MKALPCFKIRVVYSGNRGESTWLFSKEDFLPRRRVLHFNVPGQGDGTLSIDIADLEVGVQIPEDRFRMKLPEGYEQIDDFHP